MHFLYVSSAFIVRRPALDGDNWWRGHAAAFLKFVDLPPEVLRRGRVCQVSLLLLFCLNLHVKA